MVGFIYFGVIPTPASLPIYSLVNTVMTSSDKGLLPNGTRVADLRSRWQTREIYIRQQEIQKEV